MSELPLPFVGLLAGAFLATVLWRPYLAVAAFALLAPVGLTQLPGSLDVVTVMSGLVVGLAFLDLLTRARSLLPQSMAAVAACIWSLGIVGSVAFSSDLGRAAILGTWQILAAWLAVSISTLVTKGPQLRVVLTSVLVGAAIIAGSGLQGGFNQSGVFDASVVDNRAMGVFSQPNEYGLYCSMMWAFSLGVACLCRGWLRALGALCSILCMAGLAASFSRGSWLGAVAAAALMALLVPQTRRPQAVVVISVVTALSVSLVILPYWRLPSLLLSRFVSIFSGESNPYDNRPALLAEGLRQWGQHPVFGVGPNMYPVEALTIDSGTRTLEGQHAHNLIVTLGAEQGLVGLLALALFVAAVISAVRTSRRIAVPGRGRTRPREIPLGAAVSLSAMGALISMAAAGVVDYPLRNALVRSTAWMLIGILLAGQTVLRLQRSAPNSSQRETGQQVMTS